MPTKQAESEKRKRERRKAARICITCGKRWARKNSVRCEDCGEAHRLDAAARRAKKRQATPNKEQQLIAENKSLKKMVRQLLRREGSENGKTQT